MQALYISSQYDPSVRKLEIDLEALVSRPSFAHYKTKLPQIQFWGLAEGAPPKRDSSNYTLVSALILDYDSGKSIQSFIDQYSSFQFYLYTTFSNSSKCTKFRVIMPLETPIPYSLIHDRLVKKTLCEYFNGCDASGFSNFHKIPAINPKADTPYVYHINDGTPINIKKETRQIYLNVKLDDELEQRMSKPTEFMGSSDSREMTYDQKVAYKQRVDASMQSKLDQIPQCKSGNRYTSLTSVTGSLLSAKYPDGELIYDDQDVMSLITSHTNDQAIRKMVNGLTRRRSRR